MVNWQAGGTWDIDDSHPISDGDRSEDTDGLWKAARPVRRHDVPGPSRTTVCSRAAGRLAADTAAEEG